MKGTSSLLGLAFTSSYTDPPMKNQPAREPISSFIRRVMPHASERVQLEAQKNWDAYSRLVFRMHQRLLKEQGPDYIKNYCLDCQSESFIKLLKIIAKKKESENDSVEPWK
jgi:hypothetical protein